MYVSKRPTLRAYPAPGFTSKSLQIKVWLACVCLAGTLPLAASAVTLSISPTSVSNFYAGTLSVQVAGLTNGETVLLERFLDANGNNAVDSGEPLVQSFRLTDGQAASVGGVRNGNVPGDDDLAVNGQVSASIAFSTGPEFSRGVGKQVFRLSSPGGHFSPVQQILTVTPSPFPQQISGTVSNAAGPLPYAFIGVLIQVGTDNEFVGGTTADASGHFSIGVSNGTYQVIAFYAGYVGNFATSPMVTVSGADTNVTVTLAPAGLTISGNVADTANGVGLPGVQFFAGSGNNDYTVFFTDSSGGFNAPVTSGTWKLDSSDSSLASLGYLRAGSKTQVTVSGSSVNGVTVPVTRGTAMLYGTLKDDQGNALPNVRLFGSNGANSLQSSTYTVAGGNYWLVVSNGTWFAGADGQSSGLPSGYILQQAQVTLSDGQAVLTNLVARRASAWLAGRAVDSNNNPINGGLIMAFGTNNLNIQVQLNSDGTFALPVWGGSWVLGLETQNAAQHNVVCPQLNFGVTDGSSISNINYVAPVATRSISGWVRNSTNAGISSLNVFAGAFVNGTNYNAGGNTDSGGNYFLPVIAGNWNVGVDSQTLQQLGYGPAPSQNTDTSSGNQTVNFLLGGPPVGTLFFRQTAGVIGDFGAAATPAVTYPVSFKNYRAIFHVFSDTNPPTADTVLFTGPPGSGLTNTPADISFGAVQDGTNVYYFSPPVRNPHTASGGNWTVLYRGSPNNLSVPDPQANSRLVIPVPTVTVTGDLLRGLSWTYKDPNGNSLVGKPGFVRTNRIDLIDQNGNGVDAEVFPAASSYSYPSTNLYNWSMLGVLRVDYYDDMGNQYFVGFSESNPSLSSAARVPGQGYQFMLNGPPGQNYTVQYATNLLVGGWYPLVVTNSLTSPIPILDRATTNGARFYRVLVGP